MIMFDNSRMFIRAKCHYEKIMSIATCPLQLKSAW